MPGKKKVVKKIIKKVVKKTIAKTMPKAPPPGATTIKKKVIRKKRVTRTMGVVFAEAISKTSKEEAKQWFDAEVEKIVKEVGKDHETAAKTLRENLGYFAGYYGPEEAKKIFEFYGAEHPVFKSADYFKS